MAIAKDKLLELIVKAFDDAEVKITALVDDGDHYEVEICSSKFNGQSKLKQHRMVNDALDGILGGKLHALSIKTKPRE